MPFATISTIGRSGRRGRGRRRRPPPYSVLGFVTAYLASLAVVVLSALFSGIFAIPVYFVTGVFLTRYISNRVRWLKIASSVENVAVAKARTVLTWPISVP